MGEKDGDFEAHKIEQSLVPYFSQEDGARNRSQEDKNRMAEPGKAGIGKDGTARQMVYGNLKLGNFDEEITGSGINLSKLFSVYGPKSAEGKRSKKVRQSH